MLLKWKEVSENDRTKSYTLWGEGIIVRHCYNMHLVIGLGAAMRRVIFCHDEIRAPLFKADKGGNLPETSGRHRHTTIPSIIDLGAVKMRGRSRQLHAMILTMSCVMAFASMAATSAGSASWYLTVMIGGRYFIFVSFYGFVMMLVGLRIDFVSCWWIYGET